MTCRRWIGRALGCSGLWHAASQAAARLPGGVEAGTRALRARRAAAVRARPAGRGPGGEHPGGVPLPRSRAAGPPAGGAGGPGESAGPAGASGGAQRRAARRGRCCPLHLGPTLTVLWMRKTWTASGSAGWASREGLFAAILAGTRPPSAPSMNECVCCSEAVPSTVPPPGHPRDTSQHSELLPVPVCRSHVFRLWRRISVRRVGRACAGFTASAGLATRKSTIQRCCAWNRQSAIDSRRSTTLQNDTGRSEWMLEIIKRQSAIVNQRSEIL